MIGRNIVFRFQLFCFGSASGNIFRGSMPLKSSSRSHRSLVPLKFGLAFNIVSYPNQKIDIFFDRRKADVIINKIPGRLYDNDDEKY